MTKQELLNKIVTISKNTEWMENNESISWVFNEQNEDIKASILKEIDASLDEGHTHLGFSGLLIWAVSELSED